MKTRIVVLLVVLTFTLLQSQTNYCPQDPPNNPFLADSPWPTFHRNAYRQSSTCLAGPLPGAEIIIKSRLDITGGTSPWVYISEQYPSGERVLVQSNATHFFKFIDTNDGLLAIDSTRIDFDFISSFGFAFVQTKDNKWFVPDPKYDPENNRYSRIIKIEDANPSDPYSELIQSGVFSFADTPVNKVSHLALNFSGQIVFTGATDEVNNVAHVGILDQDLNVLDIFEYPTFPDEIVSHNSSPVDENNSWYLVTTHRLIRFDWDGDDITIGWEAHYDFVNDGPTGSFAEGSGTTPTLMGYGDDEDKLVFVADGHNQNNLVAFWRELPAGWTGIPGQDIRFADAIDIPLAQASNNTFQSIENSPTAYGYSTAIAQYNGFLGYDCDNEKGVQKFTWNTATNQWELNWTNGDINMNGVLTYSAGSDLVYSSGKEEDCNYYMYGLNWETGALDLRILLGPEGTFLDDPYYDAGNNTIIDENGSLYMPGGGSLLKLEVSNPLSVNQQKLTTDIMISPNPAHQMINIINKSEYEIDFFKIFDATGKVVVEKEKISSWFPVDHLVSGLYFVQFYLGSTTITKRFIKG